MEGSLARSLDDGSARCSSRIEGAAGSARARRRHLRSDAERVDGAAQALMPDLRVIAVAGAGSDAVDHAAPALRGIPVLTSGEGLVETTADLALRLILAAARLMHDAEARLRAGSWDGGASSPRASAGRPRRDPRPRWARLDRPGTRAARRRLSA